MKLVVNAVCGILLSLYLIKGNSAQTTADQVALHSALFTTYDAGEKPYCNGSVNVTLDIALRQVIDLDEPQQVLKLNVWVRLKWQDCRLTWTPSSYGNIGNFIVPYKYVWIPDLTLYDSVASEFVGLKEYRPNIYPDGTVYYNFPTIIESLCTVNVEKFPFDDQTCKLVFGSWSYHGFDMDLLYKNPYGDLSSAEENVEWNYEYMSAVRHVAYYGCCPEPYPDVTYYLKLKRKPAFYITSLITPSLLITTMAALGYYLPVESGEKVSLQITVMLSLAVFQLLVADKLPPSADATPVIATYFNFSLCLVGMACVMAVVVLAIHYQGNRKMPWWMYNVCVLKMSRITCVYIERNSNEQQIPDKNRNILNQKISPEKKKSKPLQITDLEDPVVSVNAFTDQPTTKEPPQRENINHSDAWKKLALVIDRLSFYVFVIAFAIGTGVVFSKFY